MDRDMIVIILEMWKHRDEITFKYIKVDSEEIYCMTQMHA